MRDDVWKVLIGIGLCLLCCLNCGEVTQQPAGRQELGSGGAGDPDAGAPPIAGAPGGGGAAGGAGGGRSAGTGGGAAGDPAGGGNLCGPGWHSVIQGTMAVCVVNDTDAGAGGGTGTGNTTGAH